ncbi:MAG: hypothetical protein JST23_05790 [Bacteroidetes bacterium]|nr:hypothetical protein [Bacteroidota bacterium]
MLSNSLKNILAVVFVFYFMNCLSSCGDMFGYKKNIYGNYYLLEGDAENDISLNYKVTQGGFVQRVPARIIEYSILADSLIIAKSKQGAEILYYVIDVKKDSTYADEKSYLTGPFKEDGFYNWWKGTKENFDFIKVK